MKIPAELLVLGVWGVCHPPAVPIRTRTWTPHGLLLVRVSVFMSGRTHALASAGRAFGELKRKGPFSNQKKWVGGEGVAVGATVVDRWQGGCTCAVSVGAMDCVAHHNQFSIVQYSPKPQSNVQPFHHTPVSPPWLLHTARPYLASTPARGPTCSTFQKLDEFKQHSQHVRSSCMEEETRELKSRHKRIKDGEESCATAHWGGQTAYL